MGLESRPRPSIAQFLDCSLLLESGQTKPCCRRRYAHLSPGKYSVLRELDFVGGARAARPQLKYLYLGYYIPGNEKMMYKVLVWV